MENLYSMNQHDTEAFVNNEPAPVIPYISEGLTKAEISRKVATCVDMVLEQGGILAAMEGLAAMEQFIKEMKASDAFKQYALEELAKYGKGGYTAPSGAKLEPMEGGVKYDFSQDPTWVAFKRAADMANATLKDWEEKLKKIPAGQLLVDPESGQTLTGPSKTSTPTYKVSLKKA